MKTVDQTGDVTSAHVRRLVEEVIAGSATFVVDVEVRGTRGSQVVNIFVDSDTGLGINDLARISRDVEFLLDTEEIIPGRYSLNVSTPGLDRPLSMPRQYKKNIGRQLRVHFRKEDGTGNMEVVGMLVALDDDAIRLEVPESDSLRIPFENIIWAKVQLPW